MTVSSLTRTDYDAIKTRQRATAAVLSGNADENSANRGDGEHVEKVGRRRGDCRS